MTLTTNGKDWIANNLGRGGCFASSGISYTDPKGVSQSGSTQDVVASMVMSSSTRGPGGETRGQMNTANGPEVDDTDVTWIGNNMSYCAGGGGGGGGGTTCSTTARFTYRVSGKTINFTDTSTTSGSGCSISRRLWNLGSGMASENRTCSRTFPNYNTSYPIILTVTDSAGNKKSTSRNVRTGDAPGGGGTCSPGERECTDSTHYRRCQSNRTWGPTIRCASGNHCSNGNCVKDTAPPTGGGGGGGGAISGETGPFEVEIGEGDACSPGDPPFSLDVSGAYTYSSQAGSTKYVSVGGIEVTNPHSTCFAYYTWVTRLWDGSGYSSCPSSNPQAEDAARFFDDDGTATLTRQRIDPRDTEVLFASLEIPSSMTGTKTLCLYLWGNFNKSALTSELKSAGYSE